MKIGAVDLLGKHPRRADFIAPARPSALVQSFDAWLAQSMEWAIERKRADWSERFAAGHAFAFVFNAGGAKSSTFLAGALRPSCDSAGRQFPLAASAVVQDADGVSPAALPLVLESVWAQFSERLCVEALESWASWPTPVLSDSDEASDMYQTWVNECSTQELWQGLYGVPNMPLPAVAAVVLFTQTLLPHWGVGLPETGLTLRLPLGTLGGAGVCFWLDLLCRASGSMRVPSLFWTHTGHEGTLFLHVGTPPPSTLAELWRPTLERQEVCDLTHPQTLERAAAFGDVPSHLKVATDLDARVVDVLEGVARWAEDHCN